MGLVWTLGNRFQTFSLYYFVFTEDVFILREIANLPFATSKIATCTSYVSGVSFTESGQLGSTAFPGYFCVFNGKRHFVYFSSNYY